MKYQKVKFLKGKQIMKKILLCTTKKICKTKGFTLAEILVSLLILGVIAALTIPTLVTNIQNKQYKAAWKAAYSELAQAQKMLNVDNNGNFYQNCDDFDDYCLAEQFSKKISSTKICYPQDEEGCQAESHYQNDINGPVGINDNWPNLYTNKGYSVKFRMHKKGCDLEDISSCGWAQIDVNGLQPPNVAGKDIFFIDFYPNTIKAAPTDDEINENSLLPEDIEDNCKNGNGRYCSSLYLSE